MDLMARVGMVGGLHGESKVVEDAVAGTRGLGRGSDANYSSHDSW